MNRNKEIEKHLKQWEVVKSVTLCASVLRTRVSLLAAVAGDTDYTVVERSAAPSGALLAECPALVLLACTDAVLRVCSLRGGRG